MRRTLAGSAPVRTDENVAACTDGYGIMQAGMAADAA